MKNNITFVIFTYNEERRIERVIKNFKDYGKILIADNRSTDRTQEIALRFGCDILVRENEYIFVENQELVNLIYSRIDTQWVYWAFADEMVDKPTLDEILKNVNSNKYDVINIDRKNYYYGKFCHDLLHSRTSKVLKKGAIDFRGNEIHSMGKVVVPLSRVCFLSNKFFVHHFISFTVSDTLNTINRYSEAEVKAKYKHKVSIMYIYYQITKHIIKNYIFSKGYKSAYAGLQAIMMHICEEWVRDIKHYESDNHINMLTIENAYNVERDKILINLI
jgi:glycosyltransferase involved in cell wall biosynthesis